MRTSFGLEEDRERGLNTYTEAMNSCTEQTKYINGINPLSITTNGFCVNDGSNEVLPFVYYAVTALVILSYVISIISAIVVFCKRQYDLNSSRDLHKSSKKKVPAKARNHNHVVLDLCLFSSMMGLLLNSIHIINNDSNIYTRVIGRLFMGKLLNIVSLNNCVVCSACIIEMRKTKLLLFEEGIKEERENSCMYI